MTTYSIYLDDVDLALLPARVHRYNDFLKKELYEFQVMKTDLVEQPEPTILYTCHICAIEVPAAFAREHTASIKHRANARIASVAAQRMRALITALPPPAAASTARFCANCATTVGKNHEKTKEHRVSVMHDKMLWELMTAYVGDDDVSNYDTDDSDTDFSVKERDAKNCNGFGAWDVNGKEETQNNCDRTLKTIETANKEKGTNEATEDNQYKDKKNIDKKTKMSETDKIDSGSNEERTDSSSKDKEPEIKTGTETEAKNEDIPTSSKPKAAEIKIDYVEFVTKDNKHVKDRETEIKTGTETEAKNEDIPTSSKPKAAEIKIDYVEFVTKDNKHVKDRETEIKTGTETEVKNEDIPTSSKPKAAEIKIDYVEFVTKDNKHVKVFSDHYHSFTRKFDTINCIVCSSTFKNNVVDSHMFTLKHLNKMPSTLIDEHCVRQINDTYSHCILCNQVVKNSNVTKHHLTIAHGLREKHAVTEQSTTSKIDKAANINIASSANLAIAKATVKAASVNGNVKAPKVPEKATNEANINIDWPVIYPYEMTKQESTVRCVICDCQVPNNPDNRKGHLVGLNHAKNVKNKRLVYEYEYEVTEGPNIARCVTCDVKVTMSSRNLKQHLKGRTHADNAKTNVSYDSEYSYEDTEEPNDGVLCVNCGGTLYSPYHLNDCPLCDWNYKYLS